MVPPSHSARPTASARARSLDSLRFAESRKVEKELLLSQCFSTSVIYSLREYGAGRTFGHLGLLEHLIEQRRQLTLLGELGRLLARLAGGSGLALCGWRVC